MQLHDPLKGTTPSQRLAAVARTMRRDRIAANAKADTPIACPSVSKRALPVSEVEQLSPSPNFDFNKWLERQERINPLPKPLKLWFSIEREIDPAPQHPSIIEIQVACARHYHVSRGDIISQRRTADIVRPRQVGIYLAKAMTPRTYPDIGRRFGRRDHSTAIHAFRKIERLLKTDADLAADVAAIVALLGASDA